MPDPALRLYLCYEPDHQGVANRIDSWERTNPDGRAYAAKCELVPDSAEAERLKIQIQEQILSADVVLCIVGQTTFIDPWISWELSVARQKPGRHGMVAIMLDDLYPHPAGLLGAGTIFVKFRKNYVEDAITLAAECTNPTNDIILEE